MQKGGAPEIEIGLGVLWGRGPTGFHKFLFRVSLVVSEQGFVFGLERNSHLLLLRLFTFSSLGSDASSVPPATRTPLPPSPPFGGFVFGERKEVDRRYPQAAGGGDAMTKASWYLYLAFVRFYDEIKSRKPCDSCL